MSSTNNIKDALIRNNTMIANKLKTNFAKKDEVSELATDKVDKEVTTTGTSSQYKGTISNRATGPSIIHNITLSGNESYNERIDIGSAEETLNNHGVSLTADHGLANKNTLVLKSDSVNIKNTKNSIAKTYDVLNDLDIVEALPNAIIPSQTITFGASGNYRTLLNLSNFVEGTDYYDATGSTARTTFKNKTLTIPVKKGGTIKFKGKLAPATLTIDGSVVSTSSMSTDSSESSILDINADGNVTLAFTGSNSSLAQIIITKFVNKYVLETELNNYYTKSEVDTAISGIGGVSLSGNNTFTGINNFNNEFNIYKQESVENQHFGLNTFADEDMSQFIAEAGRTGNPAILKLAANSYTQADPTVKAALLLGDENPESASAGIVLTSSVDDHDNAKIKIFTDQTTGDAAQEFLMDSENDLTYIH